MGQGRSGIKKEMLKFPFSQPYDKPEQPKLLPERKPMIQIAERPILQHPQTIVQSKTRSKISPQEGSLFQGRLEQQDKIVSVPDYTFPKTVSEYDSTSRTKQEKACRILEGKSQLMLIHFIGPHPNQLKYLYK